MATKHKNSAGSAHILLLLGIVLVVTAIGWVAYSKIQYTQKVNKERALYAAADKEARAYIDAIAAKYPGEVKSFRYCDYSSDIYSKGALGCTVEAMLTTLFSDANSGKMVAYANEKQRQLGWSFAYDNTDPTLVGNENVINSRVYKKGSITCGIHYYYRWLDQNSGKFDKNRVEISAGCSGNALAEYYPVVERP